MSRSRTLLMPGLILFYGNVELNWFTNRYKPPKTEIETSQQVHDLLRENWDENKIEIIEQFTVMLLNRANKVIGLVDISTGGLVGTVADPKVIFSAALKAGTPS